MYHQIVCSPAGRNRENDDAARVLSGNLDLGSNVVVLAKQLQNRVYLFTKAFDLGIIEYQRVLEVTVLPLMKLAQKCQHTRAGFLHLCYSAPEALLSFWADALGTTLGWHSKSMPENASGSMKPAIKASKRAEMVKALMGARIHEVRNISALLEQL